MVLDEGQGLSTEEQQYDPTSTINVLRREVDLWRASLASRNWNVTPETARLLKHWRDARLHRHPPVLLPGRGRRDRRSG